MESKSQSDTFFFLYGCARSRRWLAVQVQNENLVCMLCRPGDTRSHESLLDPVKAQQTGWQPEPNTQTKKPQSNQKEGGEGGRARQKEAGKNHRKKGTQQNKQTSNKPNKPQQKRAPQPKTSPVPTTCC